MIGDPLTTLETTLLNLPETPHCDCGRWQYISNTWRRTAVTTSGGSTTIRVYFPGGNERNRCKECRHDLTTAPGETP
jgi:ribosomal protein L34E